MLDETPWLSASALLANEIGLHARPTVKLTKLAREYDAEIRVAARVDGPWFDAKSVVKVMRIKAPSGSWLYFKASGAEADLALNDLVGLVEGGFGEARRNNG